MTLSTHTSTLRFICSDQEEHTSIFLTVILHFIYGMAIRTLYVITSDIF